MEHYLHDELDDARARQLADHLEECSPCLDRAEFQRKLKEIVRTKCQMSAPQGLVLKVQATIRTRGTQSS